MELSFYKGKTVLITGHTGFKGTWMCKVLVMNGANVIGYSLNPPTNPSLFEITNMNGHITSVIGDIRDLESIKSCMNKYNPDIVIHMAAQPIVRESYTNPVYTYETNVMGTVNILEAIRLNGSVKSFVNVTTDKVYKNNEWEWGYRENDILDGYDPYSNSKSCSELVTSTYKNSFFCNRDIAISTCRAGNVIGGGDFAKDRIIPDCIRAMENNEEIIVRNPNSTRPYQHVLEPVCTYLFLAQAQYLNKNLQGNYNVGPDDKDCATTGNLVDLFCKIWGDKASWKDISEAGAPHEANFLKLDCSKIKMLLNWKPRWGIKDAIEKTVEWSKVYYSGKDVNKVMEEQISEYLNK
ncbi:CDP-glucose 4,6-dehydratase [Anaerocolumna sp. MB42-C2]|uniref:CDP-glucose 4,6-dehydratase n=1 Tax=Anaerocolumna sp. MB42-C2 TaxID=3070997 RepID=UPI0027E04B49|nr:CDP-glucose 4,6-dehydratase [Anaerocolumna sp. MB42-C2]WMJ90690.1 CDP-glucose 4,6-dehydratase [Anaerocolumna sp. MB42-C2]